MALVNPQIAMSYRPTVEYQPRNALAEYAQVQNILGAQTQQEVARMQMERMRQEDAEIERIHQIAMQHGGPDNRLEMGKALFASRNPQQRELGYKILQHEDAKAAFARAEEQYGYAPRAAASTAAAPTAVAPIAAAPTVPTAAATPAPGDISPTSREAMLEMGRQRITSAFADLGIPAPLGAAPQAAAPAAVAAPVATTPTAVAPAGTNALAPAAAAPPANALRPSAAAPTTGAGALTGLNGKTLPQLQQEFRTYSNLAELNAPGAKGRMEEIKREIDFIYKTNEPGADQKMMRDLGIPLTQDGLKTLEALKRAPLELERLLTASDLTPAEKKAAIRAAITKQTTHPTAAITNVNAFVPASETAQAEYMKGVRTTYDALKNASATIKNVDAAKKLIPAAAGFMGTGGEPLLKAASFLNNRFGMSISTEGVTNATELRSRLFSGVIDNLRKLDAQPTQAQQQALQEAIGNLGTDPSALPRVLDAMVETIRDKVDLYNQDVTSAEARGVKFPYKPQITLPPRTPSPGAAAAQIPTGAPTAPAAPAAAAANTVTLPDGRVMTFPNAEAAAKFKRDARLP